MDGGAEGAVAIEARGISKRFGSTQALRGVDLTLRRGQCLGLVGRNGAGKSTLVSILSGLLAPDEGVVMLDGEPAPSIERVDAWQARIATVFQHSMVVPSLTVAENVFLNRAPHHGVMIDWRAMRRETTRLMKEWGFDIDAREVCSELTVEQRQIVEIARALASGTRCLLLDEPTAALERAGVRRLFERVRQLVASGVAVLYISHHLEEVFEICQQVVVLRDGAVVRSAPTEELSEQSLVAAMVGDDHVSHAGEVGVAEHKRLEREAAARASTPRLVVRDVHAASSRGELRGVSLEIAPGERLGVTGLLGSGVATLARVVVGAVRHAEGSVLLDGKELPSGRIDKALAAGVGYVPEDRRAEGFVPLLGVGENTTLTVIDHLANRFGVLRPSRRALAARPLTEQLSIVSAGLRQPVAELSGGNQQKVTVARALASSPRLIVAITPTRGVDVASKALLLEALRAVTEQTGASLLLASDELDDLVICDRVAVIVRGQIFTTFESPPFDREALIAASEGLVSASDRGAS